MTQAIESLQSEINSKIKTLQADLNGTTKEAAMTTNKKISYLQNYLKELAHYQEKAEKINEADASGFGKTVAEIISKIKGGMATLENEK
jgi:hypothetical protein